MGSRIMALDKEITNIVQLPAIGKAGVIELLSADLLKLDESDLKKMAMVMGGELLYMKLRATYTELETPLCNFDNCYRPVDKTLWCEDHPNGIDRTRSLGHNVRTFGMVNPRTA
jgi:hypothetical protein